MRVITPVELSNTEGSYTRSSVASYVDSSGFLQTAAVNTMRITYDPETLGVEKTLLENSATNVLLYSNDFATSWVKASTTTISREVTGPDNVPNSAWIVNDQDDTVAGFIYQNVTVTPSLTTEYTLSFFAKQNTANSFEIRLNYLLSGVTTRQSRLTHTWATISTTAVASSGIAPYNITRKPYPNGWYRFSCAVRDHIDGTANVLRIVVYPTSTTATDIGSSNFYGFQLEAGTTSASSYINTTTSTVTRAADIFVGTTASLYYSTVPENDYAEWSSGTNYALGTRVIRKTTHKIYENLIAGTNATPPENTVADVSPRWGEVGPTNRWSFLDLYRNTPTTSSSVLTFAIAPKQEFDSVSLSGLEQAQFCSIVIYRQTTNQQVYSKLIDLRYRNTLGWYDYFFDPLTTAPGLVLFDLPLHQDAILVVTLIGTTGLKCGTCVFGPSEYIGSIQTGAISDVLNFSTITRDVFGNAEMVRRRNVPKTNQTLYADKSLLNKIIALRDRLNAVPALWCGLDNSETDVYFDALLIFGFYRAFSINLDNPIGITINLELEEL